MNHQIDINHLWGETVEYSFASASGNGINKRITAAVVFQPDGPVASYRVVSHGEIVIDTTDLAAAVEAYNDI